MEKKELLSQMHRYTMSIDFHDGDTDHTILKLFNGMQTSPLSLHAKLRPDTIVFFGKAFGEHQIPIKFASLAQVEVSAYVRMVPTKSAGLAIPSSISYLYIRMETKKGFQCSFESRDYEALKELLGQCQKAGVPIEDYGTGLTSILMEQQENEIETFLKEQWREVAKQHHLKYHRSDYQNESMQKD